MMTNNNAAAAAAECRSNVGRDFTLSDAYDPEFMDEERTEETAPLVGQSITNYRKAERVSAFVI